MIKRILRERFFLKMFFLFSKELYLTFKKNLHLHEIGNFLIKN